MSRLAAILRKQYGHLGITGLRVIGHGRDARVYRESSATLGMSRSERRFTIWEFVSSDGGPPQVGEQSRSGTCPASIASVIAKTYFLLKT